MVTRTLTPYEHTHLARFGFSQININDYGEMPVEYITGKVEFMDQVFEINKDTLIPRVETEELVALALEQAKKFSAARGKITIADIGTGCGAIGITLYRELQKLAIPAEIYMSDISEEALKMAKQNVEKLTNKSKQLHVFVSDLLEQFPSDVSLDVIAANLPYIPHDRINSLEESVKDFEPHVALDGGPEGLTLIQTLITQASSRQTPGSIIILEIDYTHDHQFLATHLPLDHYSLQVQFDSFHQTRFAVLQRK
jgi:release factor glutamine methyltransferase